MMFRSVKWAEGVNYAGAHPNTIAWSAGLTPENDAKGGQFCVVGSSAQWPFKKQMMI